MPRTNLREVRVEREMSAVEMTISDYYSSLTDEEVKVQAQWGAFAESEFPNQPA